MQMENHSFGLIVFPNLYDFLLSVEHKGWIWRILVYAALIHAIVTSLSTVVSTIISFYGKNYKEIFQIVLFCVPEGKKTNSVRVSK